MSFDVEDWRALCDQYEWGNAEGTSHASVVLRALVGDAFWADAVDVAMHGGAPECYAAGSVVSFLMNDDDVAALRRSMSDAAPQAQARIVELLRFAHCEARLDTLLELIATEPAGDVTSAAYFALISDHRSGRLDDQDVASVERAARGHDAEWVLTAIEETKRDQARWVRQGDEE